MICWSMQNPQSTTNQGVKGHLVNVNDVVMKDAPILLFKEGYVLDMVHLVPRAVMMDAPL